MKFLTLVAALFVVAPTLADDSTQAQQKLQERQKARAVAATQPVPKEDFDALSRQVREQGQRLQELVQRLSQLADELAEAKRQIAARPATAPAARNSNETTSGDLPIHKGMTLDEAKRIMGQPSSINDGEDSVEYVWIKKRPLVRSAPMNRDGSTPYVPSVVSKRVAATFRNGVAVEVSQTDF